MTTRDLWMIAAGVLLGFALSWSLNRQLLRAAYAIERARHHYEAAMSWIHKLGGLARDLAILVVVAATVLVAGGWLLWYSTMHGVPFFS